MKNKIRILTGVLFIFLISAGSIVWYLNSSDCKNGDCGPGSAIASVTYSVCVSGDDIAYGMDTGSGGWIDRLGSYFLDSYLGSSVGNYSFTGETMRTLLDHYDSGCGSQKADISIIAVGIKDSSQSIYLEAFRNNLKRVYEKAKQASSLVIFIGLTEVDEDKLNGLNYRNQSIAIYNDEIKNFASSAGADFIEMRGLLTKDNFSENGLHPNDLGYEKMFEKIKMFMESQKK